MKSLFNNIRAAVFKMLHSNILFLHLLVPVLGILVFCGYYSVSSWSERDKVYGYIQAVAIVFPLMISIAVSMLYELELKAGNFQTILSAPYSRIIAHGGNFISLCLLGVFASIVTVMGFGVVFRLMGFVKFSIAFYFKLSLIMFLSNVALYFIQYIICFIAGKGLSLSFGIVGTLLSPLLYLGLGDIIWRYIPYGYGIRIAAYYCERYTDSNSCKAIAHNFEADTVTAGVITIILAGIFIIWSNLWQGKSVKAE
ncbi:lantibiotic immunity ABC transporter MutG family permease subunit [Anaerocolumna xylanovorans]|uniref:ABC-2 type transport system permease protein n=1 Tax=Anaerocolumna xylanovorans DSM 12503 TaxID=1121345 RepID=A0A1M7Y5H9_9FIRM|nr:lantibiotic immunity ABC transporter MutG family permease subunit [Anaerocolumna xylanovorans]SHO47658.1 ABC-2 type transport system permease protein [Anaerocolumna xylanovorans DSM 12503]